MKKRLLSLISIIAVLALVILVPIGAFAEFDGDDVDPQGITYYGRSALASMEHGDAYVYAYDKIVECVEKSGNKASIYNGEYELVAAEIQMIYDAYRRDHTEHFWLGNAYSYTSKELLPTYIMSGDELTAARAAFDQKVNEILSGVAVGTAEFDIELYFHDLLAGRITYVESENAHNSYGAIVEGKAVCEGYAEALQYLLQRSGICSFIITGSSINPTTEMPEGHAWCAVKIDGNFYHVDLTWNDQGANLYHAYFNLTDEKIKLDHQIEEAAYPLPVCNSTEKNYFAVKGGAFGDGEYTVSAIAKLLKDGNLSANVYINGSLTDFYAWYGQNIRQIASEVGVNGNFRYGMNYLGNEAVITIIPEHVHSLTLVPAKSATCTERGNIKHYVCSCGKMFADKNATVELSESNVYYSALGHIYMGVKVNEETGDYDDNYKRSEGNCQENWTYWYTCITCDASAKDDPENQDKFFSTDTIGEHVVSKTFTSEDGKHFNTCEIAGCTERFSVNECSGGTATCTQPAVCSTCHAEYGIPAAHVFDTSCFVSQGASGHAHKCTNVYCTAISIAMPHRADPNVSENEAVLCLDCGYIITPAKDHTEHTPRDEWKYDGEKHWKICSGCEEVIFLEGEHRFEKCSGTCADCKAPLREEKDRHVFDKWEHDAEEHWRTCLCGEKNERTAHVDGDANDTCDVCGRILIKSAYADMEFLQGFISFLDKFGILRLLDPLKQKLDAALVSAGFAAGAAATLSVTIIIAGFLLIIFIILAILWLWLKVKIRRRRKMREEEED